MLSNSSFKSSFFFLFNEINEDFWSRKSSLLIFCICSKSIAISLCFFDDLSLILFCILSILFEIDFSIVLNDSFLIFISKTFSMMNDLLFVSFVKMIWENFSDNENLSIVSSKIVCSIFCEILMLLLEIVLVKNDLSLNFVTLSLILFEKVFLNAICFTNETVFFVIFVLILMIVEKVFDTLLSRWLTSKSSEKMKNEDIISLIRKDWDVSDEILMRLIDWEVFYNRVNEIHNEWLEFSSVWLTFWFFSQFFLFSRHLFYNESFFWTTIWINVAQWIFRWFDFWYIRVERKFLKWQFNWWFESLLSRKFSLNLKIHFLLLSKKSKSVQNDCKWESQANKINNNDNVDDWDEKRKCEKSKESKDDRNTIDSRR